MRSTMEMSLGQLFTMAVALVAVPLASARAVIEPRTDVIPRDDLEDRGDIEPRALIPSLDPWYRSPSGFEDAKPGDIVRTRRIIPGFFGLIPDPIEAHQLLYRTTAIDGSPITTATTVFKPLFAKTDRFVSFQTAYDSSNTMCNPSYNYRLGALPVGLITGFERFLIMAYLLSGYIVASADYEGPDAAFAAGRLEGMGVLDGIRAVGNYADELGLDSKNPPVVVVGYSGGGIATGWAASLQSKYAPELNIKGWAPGGVPANLTGILSHIDDTLFSGFIPVAFNGLTKPSAYEKELGPFVDDILTERGRDVLETTDSVCAVGALIAFPEQSVLSTEFQTLGPDFLHQPGLVEILEQHVMGVHKDETPTTPVHMYHAVPDEVVPYANASTLADSWCDKGASVEFVSFEAGGHITTEVLALPSTLEFVANAFDGKVASGCSRRSVLNETLDPIALGANLEPIAVKLIEIIADVGKGDSKLREDLGVLDKEIVT